MSAVAAEKPGETKPLDPPEKELAQILSGLDALANKVDAYSRLGRKKNASPKELTARYYLKTGLEFYERGDYLTATRFLVRYREKTQSPELADLLKADYATARSYERLGYTHKAVETYLDYLSNFLTAKDKDYTRLLDVVEAVIPLAADTDQGRGKLEEITASLLSLDYPGRLEPDLYYHAAKAALNTGSLRRASRWLEKADSLLDPAERFDLKARTRYLASLVDTRKENYDEAEETLTWVIQNAKKGSEEIRDLSRLAVARIAVHRRQPARAIRYYEAIPKNSPEAKTALFESVYLHLEAGHPKKARQNALTFLARYPQAADAYQLRSLLAYLDLKAGALETATTGLESSHKHLKKIERKLIQNLAGSERLRHDNLTALLETTRGQLAAAPPIEQSHELFGRLAELKRRLGDIRGEIRDTIFTAGKLSMDRLKPEWKRRSEQLDQLTQKLLKWGHRLAATERETYREALSRQDEAALKASADRRTSLLSGAAEWMRQKKGWRAYSRFLNETETVGELAARLGRIRASLATARYLRAKDSSAAAGDDRLRTLEKRETTLVERIHRSIKLLRRTRIAQMLDQAPHMRLKKLLSQYALALHEEAQILSHYRKHPRSTPARFMAEESREAWRRWRHLAKRIYDKIADLDSTMSSWINRFTDKLEGFEKRHERLTGTLQSALVKLETRLGERVPDVMDHYLGRIRRRLERNRKWRADLEWLEIKDELSERQRMRRKFDLERQILQENLKDLRQGVLWRWQD